jgi:glycosyltransferase involved in cell wall biosynthesis
VQIAFYCPDRHLLYDGATPDRTGVGGGITVRIRIAAALARRGHAVTLICNCPMAAVHDGVRYLPIDSAPAEIRCEAMVMHSSGGAYDLSGLLDKSVEAKVRVLMLSGPELPKSALKLAPDAFYACSNFLRPELVRQGVASERIFVTYHGINRWNRAGLLGPARDSRRLIYSSHPSKGLHAAREVTRLLRKRDQRFTLHSFGGNRLWGGTDEAVAEEPGIVHGGLVGQRRMAAEFKRSAFSLQLQTRLEPFGITIVEAMAAGCIVVASPVGSYPELIRNGENGFLVEGIEHAAELIWNVGHNPELMRSIRRRAFETPIEWDTVAQVWESHFEWLVGGGRTLEAEWARCLECGASCLMLPDGYHCTACGNFARSCAPWKSNRPSP